MKSGSNVHDTREGWLRAATNELRPYFDGCSYPLPDKIRFAIGFPSTGRKGNRVGECWHSSTSADEHFEIFIRADLSEPEKVLGVLVHELVHAVVPVDAKHGKKYRDAAVKIGLQGKMVHAMPGILLRRLPMGVNYKMRAFKRSLCRLGFRFFPASSSGRSI